MQIKKEKLFVYVDESGQDTKGLIFVVSILILDTAREQVEKELEMIEQDSGKKKAKWHKAKREFREQYVEMLLERECVRKSIFFDMFSDQKKYIELTAYATAKAILKRAGKHYQATVFVDGLKGKEKDVFRRVLRELRVKTRKIRGVKKDENNACIRLVDTICGLIRDGYDGQERAQVLMRNYGIKIFSSSYEYTRER